MLNRITTPSVHHSVQSSFMEYMRQRESAQQLDVIRFREYDTGVHETQLTARLQQFLQVGSDADFTMNYCPLVINAKSERLKVTGFSVDGDNAAVSDKLWYWWRRNRMDRKQNVTHRAAIRDGDAYVLVEWDAKAQMPRYHYEPAFDGTGVQVYYSPERRDEIEFASKRWVIERGSEAGKIRRLNLYFPDRIEKYISNGEENQGHWQPFMDESDPLQIEMMGHLGMAGVSWWTDDGTETGEPLGVPVVHFKHNDTGDSHGTSHIQNIIPVQDALNKSMIDLLGLMDTAGFGLLVGTGTTAWSSAKVAPGAIAAVSLPSNEADLKRLSGDDPTALLTVYNGLVLEVARLSGTPLSYFQQSGQVAAEGTLKQQESAMISQVEKTQTDFGNAWEDVLQISIRLNNAFAPNSERIDFDDIIDTIWQEAETRNDKEQAETLAIRVRELGVSENQAQIEMGYDATQRAGFERDRLRRQAQRLRASVPLLPANAQSQQEPNNEPNQALNQTENGDTEDNAA